MGALSARLGVFVGVATRDTIALVHRFPTPDERIDALQIVRAGGGPAAIAAVACARLGVPASFVGAIGDDAEGDELLHDLTAEGVSTEGVVRVRGARTSSSVVLVDQARDTRAIVNKVPPLLRIAPGSVAADLIASAEWVHVDQVGWQLVQPLIGSTGQLWIDGEM